MDLALGTNEGSMNGLSGVVHGSSSFVIVSIKFVLPGNVLAYVLAETNVDVIADLAASAADLFFFFEHTRGLEGPRQNHLYYVKESTSYILIQRKQEITSWSLSFAEKTPKN
jgi:hypothetical protein